MSHVENPAGGPSGSVAGLSRTVLRDALADLLQGLGVRWAWQGPAGAPELWDGDTGPSDLDVWWDPTDSQRIRALTALQTVAPSAVVARSEDPRRLRHESLAFEVAGHLALVDLTQGDLRVGAVLLWPAAKVSTVTAPEGPRLSGPAGAADLLIRPLLRGKLPPPTRLDQARRCWAEASQADRVEATALWREQLGSVAGPIVAVLDGAEPAADLPRQARKVLLSRTLAPSGVRAAWRQRWSVVPAGRSAGPLKLRTRGVVVALVGTDGSGKSTVAKELAARLDALGFNTSSAYFGMARGNLPGVDMARRILGVPTEPEQPKEPAVAAPSQLDEPPGEPTPLAHPGLRKVAAWYYAAEYAWRYATKVAPQVKRRRVVICDRYVYDLRDSPWPGSGAAKAVQFIVPRPDVLILPDAPAAVIHARKPERPQWEQARQQAEFRSLLAERPARASELILDTSGATPDAVAPAVAAVVQAAHQPRGAARE